MAVVKLRDIAEKARVTISTASAALNGAPGVGEEKRKLIIATAKELGYYPNLAAKLLKSHDCKVLGICISDQIQSFSGHGVYSDLIAEMLAECQAGNWRPNISISNPLDDKGDGIPQALTDGMVSACVFCGVLSDKVKAWLRARPEFPFVAFNEPWDYCVRSDSAKGVFKAVESLASTGHKRICMVCGPEEFDIHRQAGEGFEKAVSACGLDARACRILRQRPGWKNEDNLPYLDSLFDVEAKPDALILSGRKLTATALYHLAGKGLFVPRDLSVASLCSGWEATAIYPEASTIQFDIRLMASLAMKLLSQRLSGDTPEKKEIWVEPKFVLRKTTLSRAAGKSLGDAK